MMGIVQRQAAREKDAKGLPVTPQLSPGEGQGQSARAVKDQGTNRCAGNRDRTVLRGPAASKPLRAPPFAACWRPFTS